MEKKLKGIKEIISSTYIRYYKSFNTTNLNRFQCRTVNGLTDNVNTDKSTMYVSLTSEVVGMTQPIFSGN